MTRNKFLKKTLNIFPEVIFNSYLVKLLINSIMKNGKKSVAEYIVYQSLKKVQTETKKDSLEILEKAIKNIKPQFKLSIIKIKGIKSNVPIELNLYSQLNLAIKWLVGSANQRNEKGFSNKLANEIIDASVYTGNSIKKRDQLHKQIEANKSYLYTIKPEILNKY